MFHLINIHDTSRDTMIFVCSFKNMVEALAMGHSQRTSRRLVLESLESRL